MRMNRRSFMKGLAALLAAVPVSQIPAVPQPKQLELPAPAPVEVPLTDFKKVVVIEQRTLPLTMPVSPEIFEEPPFIYIPGEWMNIRVSFEREPLVSYYDYIDNDMTYSPGAKRKTYAELETIHLDSAMVQQALECYWKGEKVELSLRPWWPGRLRGWIHQITVQDPSFVKINLVCDRVYEEVG